MLYYRATMAVVWALGGGVLAAGLDLSRMENVTLSEFRTKGVTDDGKVSWELRGGQAKVKANLADIDGIELKFHTKDRESVTITSPKCAFNQATQIGHSDAPIHIESKSFRLDGVGYDVYAGEHRVRVRQQVRMSIALDEKARRKIDDFGPRNGKQPAAVDGGAPAPAPAAAAERKSGQEAKDDGK